MKEVKINYENILNPNRAFKNYLKELMPLYIDDYGNDVAYIIKRRIAQTIYIFDSLPIDELDFLIEHKNSINDKNRMRNSYEECSDFISKKKIIDNKLDEKYYSVISKVFGAENRYIDELFSLDIDSYSATNQLILSNPSTPQEEKESIIKRQEAYRKECERLKIKCIKNKELIDKLFKFKEGIEYNTNLSLIRKTKWVKKIKETIYNLGGGTISDCQLTELLFYCMTASTNIIEHGGKITRICYFPLMKNMTIGNVDGMFFHENRHVVELSNNCSGLQIFSDDRYRIINEIRTEKNALRDKKKLEDKVLFSNGDFIGTNANVYEQVFPCTEGFFERYRDILNKLAFLNDYKSFEKLFGKNNLIAFDNYLSEVEEEIGWGIKLSSNSSVDKPLQKTLVRKLDRHYNSCQNDKKLV